MHSRRYQSLTLVLYDSGKLASLPRSCRAAVVPRVCIFWSLWIHLNFPCFTPAPADTLLPDEEIGRAEVPLSSLNAAPGAQADLWLPLVPPYRQRHSRRARRLGAQQSEQLGPDVLPSAGASFASLPAPQVAAREDTARGGMLWERSSPAAAVAAAQQRQQASTSPFSRVSMSVQRLAALVPSSLAAGGGSKECQLHVRCSYNAFTREEVEAAGAATAGRPGIVTIMRRQGWGVHACAAGREGLSGCVPALREWQPRSCLWLQTLVPGVL